MNKNDAAEYLEIGLRTLERYTSKGRVAAVKVRTKSGIVLDYDEAELARFKAELETPVQVEVPEASPPLAAISPSSAITSPPHSAAEPPSSAMTLARLAPQALAEDHRSTETGVIVPLEVLANLADVIRNAQQQPRTLPADKLLLTLDDAQELTSLSRARLRAAIDAADLPACKIGRSWRVKRADLEEFVRNL